ncbi:TonB-linked outer membrane protein, SusC/RagA family [Flaviramulus basaltis]|uniref:TonB-linked outer membrane protein, SusC/RagA family n=1 Tax=Flaviramulus basaltis TaxID=369401 RepID=A0A1K2IIC5_9FLAO|nr:TonB-dependent receptor [Flaviramulus basaltis]SFZ92054.1 TonB-linked outer membrane protein, SusC/RagA family [Flaviramulus basaltis]
MTNNLLLKTKPKTLYLYGFMLLLFVFSVKANAQSTTVSGKVTDESGIPLPGVNVIVQNTSTGTSTDFDGLFSINASSNAVLEFSYLGYVNQSISVNGRTTINISLKEDVSQLDEVVVVGYGTMERSNVTGAITTVDVAAIEKTPVPNVVEALRGQVAGLRVTRGNGQPGSGVNFTIRGINSLGEGSGSVSDANQPIIVVDGVPLPGGNLSELNPDDIESVNVIKDAGAGAIYGSSAANGVVLITTKSGKAGKPTISVNASTAFNDVTNRVNIMNGDEYVKFLFDSGLGTTLNGTLNANELTNYVNGNSVDWQDELLRQGISKNVSLSVSGGSDQLSFYLNGDMYQEGGIVTDSDYNRYSLRFNGEYRPSDKVKIGARVQLTKSFADETSNTISEFNINGGFAPFIPIFNNTPLGDLYLPDGSYAKFVTNDQFQVNPFHRYNESIVDRTVTRSYVNPYVEIGLADGLSYTLNTFAEDRSQFYGRFTSSNYIDGDPSTAQVQRQNSVNYLVDNILHYKKDFGKHGIDATFVYGFQKNEFEQFDAFSDKLATDLLGYNAIDDSATADQRFSWDTDESGRVYYVGRVGYDYDNRYVVTLTLRRDGSSRFTGDNVYGNFPSVSLAWNANKEKFWDADGLLNALKFRGSYGTLGNDRIGTYRYLANPVVVRSTVLDPIDEDDDGTPDGAVERNIVGYAKGTLANPYLKWETSKQLNVGLDFGLLNNRISGTVDYYNTKTTDLLLPEIIPVINGYESYINNVGETKNSGLEISLKSNVIENEDFTWNLALNWAQDKNEIVSLSRGSKDADGNPIDDPANGWFIGQPIGVIYNYKYLGVWQTEEVTEAAAFGQVPGDAKFQDVNGDGSITPGEDRLFLGSGNPDWYGGITNTFTYKGLELSVLVEVVEGVTRVNNFIGGYTGRNNQVAIDYWTPDNPSNSFPRVGGSGNYDGGRGDAVKTQDASFVAIRNVSLTYNLPTRFLEKTPLKALSMYVRGNNLKYFTDFDNAYSPEAGIGAYPITRTITFGTSITF